MMEPQIAAQYNIFMVPSATAPTGWTNLVGFGTFHEYNPANPQDPPRQTGVFANTYVTTGDMAAANIPTDSLLLLLGATNVRWPPQGLREIYVPPAASLVMVNSAANTAVTVSIMLYDPTFDTQSRI